MKKILTLSLFTLFSVFISTITTVKSCNYSEACQTPSLHIKKIATPIDGVACSCEWVTQKETLKLLQSGAYAEFIKNANDLGNGAIAYFSTGLMVALATLLACIDSGNGNQGGDNHHHHYHHYHNFFPAPSYHVSIPAGQLFPSLGDAENNITIENLHKHITPIKVKVRNDSDKAIILSKSEYLSPLQGQSIAPSRILDLFPNINDHKSSLRWSYIGTAFATLFFGAASYVAGKKTIEYNATQWQAWVAKFLLGTLAAGLGIFTGLAAKSSYDCWNGIDVLDALKKHHDKLTDSLVIVYDNTTGTRLTPNDFSFGYTVPPHATFESILFVRTDRCEEFLINATSNGAIKLNAQPLN